MSLKDPRSAQEREEALRRLTAGSLAGLAQTAAEKTPETGHFTTRCHRFLIPGTKNYAQFTFAHPRTSAAEHRTLVLEVFRKDTDVSYSVFLGTGTKPDLLAAMEDPARVPEAISHIRRLSGKVDDYWQARG